MPSPNTLNPVPTSLLFVEDLMSFVMARNVYEWEAPMNYGEHRHLISTTFTEDIGCAIINPEMIRIACNKALHLGFPFNQILDHTFQKHLRTVSAKIIHEYRYNSYSYLLVFSYVGYISMHFAKCKFQRFLKLVIDVLVEVLLSKPFTRKRDWWSSLHRAAEDFNKIYPVMELQ